VRRSIARHHDGMDTLVGREVPVPAVGSPGAGEIAALALRAAVLGHQQEVPASLVPGLSRWIDELQGLAKGDPLGLDPAGLPEAWREALAWSGMPLAPRGALVWGRDLREQQDVELPRLDADVLLLPRLSRFACLTSLDLKPVRLLVAQRCGVRLQSGVGLHLFLWANQAVMCSRLETLTGGFLHGPAVGQRHGLSVDPGGVQHLLW